MVTSFSSFCQQNKSKPEIIGQTPSPLHAIAGSPITIELSNLIVTDEDPTPVYPEGYTLEITGGKDYKVQGTTVTPDADFEGMLSVSVRVDDGQRKSDKFDLQISVTGAQNSPPQIIGQQPLSINQGESITIAVSHLTVTDPDNSYPTGFTLKLYGGNNYTINGTTVTPSANFSGTLSVPVTVNDGENESEGYNLQIEVIKPENKPPTITGQQPLSINQGESITIALNHLTVTDPDNTYPTGFTLKLFGGNNYTFNGATVTPSANFFGTLSVPVTVNDGENESERFDLQIAVIKPENKPPTITGQQPLSINQGESITIGLSHLIVTDPDNTYPTGFTLKLFGGNNYTFNGTTVTPAANFSGTLSVPVTVNDGENESERNDLQITVIRPENKPPTITGQQPISINQGESITIALTHLTVTDPDNTYPTGFTLKLFGGNNYTFNGATVTPSANFSGTLSVQWRRSLANNFRFRLILLAK